MQTVNIHEAKTHLSRLVDQAANGESFVIAKAGKLLVKVVPPQCTRCGAGEALGVSQGSDRGARRLQYDGEQGNRAAFRR